MNIKSLLYLITNFFLKKRKLLWQLSFLLIFISSKSQQIANYINNGGFEQHYNCTIPSILSVKYWRNIDSLQTSPSPWYCSLCIPNVPNNGLTYQWPHSGQSYGMGSLLCQPPQCNPLYTRGYFRNRLKANLINGKTYCVKLYVNISDAATYAVANLGLFFVDNSIDTITKSSIPLTYIIPQIANPTSNILTDTMNWVPITGTFVANGTEKNCVIGNFKSDAATTKTLINPTNLPTIGCDILIDDVSCIPIDLPAYAAAGSSIWAIPGNTIYLGRPQDVGIDEACEWFILPNTTSVIANAAGLTLTVAITTNTYMVKQTICGVIKYDTVVVYASGLGIGPLSGVEADKLMLYPNPANEILNIELQILNEQEPISNLKFTIYNSLGQLVREEDIVFKNNTASIDTKELENGVYNLILSSRGTRDLDLDSSYRRNDKAGSVSKRFVIAR